MSDLFQEAQEDLNEQARWGENRVTMAVRKALVVIRILAGRLKRLEERVDALENPPP